MELRWTQEVAADLERIADYLVAHTPERAARPRACAVRGAEHPADFPNFGRPGKKEDTRELMMSPLPYIVIYSVREDAVFLVRILHGAQQWP